eukprot:CAMPEP_0115002092 /NCGR_PEP_ID=MMETSP0216-20121206/17795_1 /TAXON_ID=223996 /ORGANISM="Protocruzia adherens, Strain Boccale" /LENGTH=601 /DNA_ID=CAMNT_0002367611 /DNA_START=161 /DNA_END=1966 /DNA_ORIENTATION=-
MSTLPLPQKIGLSSILTVNTNFTDDGTPGSSTSISERRPSKSGLARWLNRAGSGHMSSSKKPEDLSAADYVKQMNQPTLQLRGHRLNWTQLMNDLELHSVEHGKRLTKLIPPKARQFLEEPQSVVLFERLDDENYVIDAQIQLSRVNPRFLVWDKFDLGLCPRTEYLRETEEAFDLIALKGELKRGMYIGLRAANKLTRMVTSQPCAGLCFLKSQNIFKCTLDGGRTEYFGPGQVFGVVYNNYSLFALFPSESTTTTWVKALKRVVQALPCQTGKDARKVNVPQYIYMDTPLRKAPAYHREQDFVLSNIETHVNQSANRAQLLYEAKVEFTDPNMNLDPTESLRQSLLLGLSPNRRNNRVCKYIIIELDKDFDDQIKKQCVQFKFTPMMIQKKISMFLFDQKILIGLRDFGDLYVKNQIISTPSEGDKHTDDSSSTVKVLPSETTTTTSDVFVLNRGLQKIRRGKKRRMTAKRVAKRLTIDVQNFNVDNLRSTVQDFHQQVKNINILSSKSQNRFNFLEDTANILKLQRLQTQKRLADLHQIKKEQKEERERVARPAMIRRLSEIHSDTETRRLSIQYVNLDTADRLQKRQNCEACGCIMF